MGLNLPRAVKAVISLVVDDGLAMWRRIEAADALMQFDVPAPVVDATRRFLLQVAENPTSNPGNRLAAAKAVLKRDQPKFKRVRVEPPKWDPLRQWGENTTAAEWVEKVLRLTAERDARLEQLKLVTSVEDPATDKAG
jgi:hypothetical protein